MTDQTAAIEVWARVLCAADAHVHGCPTWQQLPTAPGPSGRSQDDYRKVAAWLLPRMTVADPAEQAPACPDPIECGHEAALGEAREEIRRLGLMVDEYAAGARGLSERLREERTRADAMTRAMVSTAADALMHGGCHRKLMGQCLRAEKAEAAVEEQRLALSQALGLGTGAPWDAIRDRAAELSGAETPAVEAQQPKEARS